MSHYEQRLEQDLASIRERVAEIGRKIEVAIGDSVHSLLHLDRSLASSTILGDLPINRATREIDRRCHAFVARHLPSAGHLRFVSSVLRLSIGLERIGDYAVTIAREAVQLSTPPPAVVARDLEMMCEQSRRMFVQAIKAFNQSNPELARGTMAMADQVDSSFEKVFKDLLAAGEEWSRPVKDLFATLIVFNRLERISDQAKNICEETIFAATGETKAPKVYRILFLDEKNDGLSLLAEAMARKAFPESGTYASAGWKPAREPDARIREFASGQGIDLSQARPTDVERLRDELDDFHVIVALEPGVWDCIGTVPFHTAIVEWSLGTPGTDGEGKADDGLKTTIQDLKLKLHDLMETLRGEGAA